MGVRIITGDRMAAMYCSTTDWAFGPIFNDDDDHDAGERLELFLTWLRTRQVNPSNRLANKDPREYTDSELESLYGQFLVVEKELWQEKEAV